MSGRNTRGAGGAGGGGGSGGYTPADKRIGFYIALCLWTFLTFSFVLGSAFFQPKHPFLLLLKESVTPVVLVFVAIGLWLVLQLRKRG